MPHINIGDVEKTAALAKLDFNGEEMEKFAGQFDRIIGFVEKISELDTDNVMPTTHAVENINVFRRDTVSPSMTNNEIESIAPRFSDGNIVVPKIIEY